MYIVALCALIAGAAVCWAAWRWLGLRQNRRRATQVLCWIEFALAGRGQATGVRWIARSRFKVPLHLRSGVFHRACFVVDLIPREAPMGWLASKFNGQREVLTFQADLDLPPAFSLDVHNFRWSASSSRKPPGNRSSWGFEHTGPVVISTRMDWQKEISSAMASLARDDNREFLDISFQRRSPHFSATLPLQAIAPGSPTRACMFEAMRELAASSSASLS